MPDIERNKVKKESWELVKNKKVIQCIKVSKKFKIFSLKIHKAAGIWKKKTKKILNKGTKHKKKYMEGLNSKNKNIDDVGSP